MRTLPVLLAGLLVVGLLGTVAATSGLPSDRPAPDLGDQIADGRALYLASCASCHGRDAEGTPNGPSLVDVGAASADFYLRTGRMPLAAPGVQPHRKAPAFDEAQIAALVAYVASLGNGPPIPDVSVDERLLARGAEVYFDNCGPCHGTTARGGAVGGGAIAPPLDRATPVQVAEAMIIGPGQMPVFGDSPGDLDAVATYVEFLRRAPNPGGFAIGGIGPVPEGYVGWVFGIGILFPIVYLIGRSWTRKSE